MANAGNNGHLERGMTGHGPTDGTRHDTARPASEAPCLQLEASGRRTSIRARAVASLKTARSVSTSGFQP